MKKIYWGLLVFLSSYSSWSQETFPVNDISSNDDECFAFINATIVKNAEVAPMPSCTLVIRKGKIISIGQNVTIPADALIEDCQGKYIYPSFIDLYSDYGIPIQNNPRTGGGRGFGGPSQMISDAKYAAGWNAAIKAEADASKVFQVNDEKAKAYRAAGFGLINTHIHDGIVRGNGSLVSLATIKENLAILKPVTTAHFSFSKGTSTQDYPNSLMGTIALIRQTFYDAEWYKTKPVTEGTNLTLAAFNQLTKLPLIFESGDKWNDLRVNKIGKEFNVDFITLAGTNEYQRINDVKASGAKMIVPVNFPNAMDVEDPNDARFVALADLKHWEMAPSNPAALDNNGIMIALTANGLKDINSFIPNVNKAIQYGLSEKSALKALTTGPASVIGISDLAGSLDINKYANFIITSGPLFKDKTTILQNWVMGIAYNIKPEGWKDIKGNYDLTINQEIYKAVIASEPGGNNNLRIYTPDTVKADLKINDKLVNINFTQKKDSSKLNRLSGVETKDGWSGMGQLANGVWAKWSLKKNDAITKSDSAKTNIRKSPDPGKVLYPFQGYGNYQLPAGEEVIIKNGTIWTSDKDGILENTDLLIQNGKIAKIGKNLSSTTAKIIDARGMHITPGIIDEHSHIAGTGNINECSQSVTAEVRMADIINPDDINIYRQLSGGVTSSHLLHGSCNTIGGQTQLIKLRWGKNAEEMKFEGWPGFIKFALGENVKRSSSNQNNRFPDTRMGVEQLLDDAFTRAEVYAKAPAGKRRDLELDALVEILNDQRNITCHSYVASEILSLLGIADKHHFKVNTFTHILEGYKVADQLKAHHSAAAGFSDWWAYKNEVQDAIPQNAYILSKVGVNAAINSDDAEMARRLNQEAAKSIKYAGMNEEDALKLVTINPATMLHVDQRVGSIKVGKDADIVIWNDHPLSIYARAEKTYVDGVLYFDREKDKKQQEWVANERNRLIQKALSSKKGGGQVDSMVPSFQEEAQCEEDHNHSKSLLHRIEQRMVYSQN